MKCTYMCVYAQTHMKSVGERSLKVMELDNSKQLGQYRCSVCVCVCVCVLLRVNRKYCIQKSGGIGYVLDGIIYRPKYQMYK